jgi:hypothetical protein
VTFIDDYSRFTWVYFLRSKVDVFSIFQTFVAYVETQFSTCVKILRSDSGGEYMSHAFQSFLQQKGILSQRSCPCTPQQNGVAKRKNRHLLDVVHTLMLESFMPSRFWVEALSTTVYLINRLPSPTLHLDSPYSRLFGVLPDYNSLHVFGCVCFVHLPPIESHKLAAQSVQCAFLGYSNFHKGFVCYDADANKLRISRNEIFFENQYFFLSRPNPVSSSILLPPFDVMSSTPSHFKPSLVYQRRRPLPLPSSEPPPDPVVQAPRRSPPDWYDFSSTLQATLDTTSMPKSYSQASTRECWRQAM